MADASDRAYLAGLRMLARRELSEMQVRARLGRREYAADQIEAAVRRLREERAIDDARTARAIARTAVSTRGHGKRRVRMQVDAAGIEQAVASAAVDEVFNEIDMDVLLQAAVARRLRGRTAVADDREAARLFRYLIRQGFDGDRVMQALRKLRAADTDLPAKPQATAGTEGKLLRKAHLHRCRGGPSGPRRRA